APSGDCCGISSEFRGDAKYAEHAKYAYRPCAIIISFKDNSGLLKTLRSQDENVLPKAVKFTSSITQ
ncbi:MAG: hypothetical protein NTX04_11195, partial [Verrucomicrobia bacterium]|nr:hypothetical protein [Verrucomicrobiota bacterium]